MRNARDKRLTFLYILFIIVIKTSIPYIICITFRQTRVTSWFEINRLSRADERYYALMFPVSWTVRGSAHYTVQGRRFAILLTFFTNPPKRQIITIHTTASPLNEIVECKCTPSHPTNRLYYSRQKSRTKRKTRPESEFKKNITTLRRTFLPDQIVSSTYILLRDHCYRCD